MKDDDALKKFLEGIQDGVRNDMLPKMRSSRCVLGYVEEGDMDAFLLLQVGAAVLLGKPLLLIVHEHTWIPKRAREVADEIVVVSRGFPLNPADKQKVEAALMRIETKLQAEERRQ